MATLIHIPTAGQSGEEVVISRWFASDGDVLKEGDPVCEIETEKAALEISAPVNGTLLARFFPEGSVVAVHALIAVIGEPGEDISALESQALPGSETSGGSTVEPSLRPESPAPIADAVSGIAPRSGDVEPADPASGVSPRARNRLTTRPDIDGSSVVGSGPGGRVIERDVVAAGCDLPPLTRSARAAVATASMHRPDRGSGIGGRARTDDLSNQPARREHQSHRLSGVRAVIAERMMRSLNTTAQLTLHRRVNVQRIIEIRSRCKQSDHEDVRGITIGDLLSCAVTRALRRQPGLNATLEDGMVTEHRAVHLGIAVDTPHGLLVPVLRSAHQMTVTELSAETKRLATACRDRRVLPDELQGGTFTISNLGGLGVDWFTPILNAPQVAILGVGAIIPQTPDGSPEAAAQIQLSLTIDHQAVDGAPGARFLQALAQIIADFDPTLPEPSGDPSPPIVG